MAIKKLGNTGNSPKRNSSKGKKGDPSKAKNRKSSKSKTKAVTFTPYEVRKTVKHARSDASPDYALKL